MIEDCFEKICERKLAVIGVLRNMMEEMTAISVSVSQKSVLMDFKSGVVKPPNPQA